MRLALSLWILTILCHFISPASSQLECWSCDYAKDCNDPFNEEANRTIVSVVTELESSPCVYCSKIKTKAYGYHHVERTCVPESMDYITHELECSENIINGVEYTYCYCDEPYCNNSPLTNTTPASLIVTALLYIWFILGY